MATGLVAGTGAGGCIKDQGSLPMPDSPACISILLWHVRVVSMLRGVSGVCSTQCYRTAVFLIGLYIVLPLLDGNQQSDRAYCLSLCQSDVGVLLPRCSFITSIEGPIHYHYHGIELWQMLIQGV
jgi:hypothetical protein